MRIIIVFMEQKHIWLIWCCQFDSRRFPKISHENSMLKFFLKFYSNKISRSEYHKLWIVRQIVEMYQYPAKYPYVLNK